MNNPRELFNRTWPVCLGLLLMFIPAFWWLINHVWDKESQAHGPIVLGISFWLIYRNKDKAIATFLQGEKKPAIGWGLLLSGCVLFILGKSQSIDLILAFSFIVVLASLLLLYGGWAAIKAMWFPLFFMLFMLPLPGGLVAALTLPMKMAVSYVAEWLLYHAGYPVSRSGVIIQIDQYQMLVADACAGLHTLFTLEAIGLLYLNLMGYKSFSRNLFIALMVVPISFAANTIRVITLILITYYFGDEAGQGFLHGFAGFVLFGVALFLLMSFDTLVGFVMKKFGITDAGVKKHA
ncbi:exosortase B [Janthinobacterium sp. B9-8]|uniref:exosortase B n=1 Tax=Janthinobacterium sp. B9-8 TaxID=1236179 RepID=UPI0018D25163|nr:exosortase B [Janthinobacterium sp. B9-8]